MSRSALCAVGFALLTAARAEAQRTWQADVQIQSLDVSQLDQSLVARVVVYSDNHDDARAVHVEILLPLGVGVTRTAMGCSASASPPGVSELRAKVLCDMGTLPVHTAREIFVITTLPPVGTPKTFGVFASSDTPDPRPANNFAEKTLP